MVRAGDILGKRYRLDERVDGGAMGDVWRGTDTRLNRQVAVKVLHAALSTTTEFRNRFSAEARAAAALRAPGVVDLYDYGEDHPEDGTVISYLVMEFVPGPALSKIIADKGRIPPGDTMAMIGKCAKALDAAHQAGVIHRDVKPGNILVLDDGNIKVVDFGIARAHGESGLTATGQVMGTVAYVSPEQLYDEELSGATDLYSLGIVAYECLAGVKPFTGDAPAAVIRAQLQQEPPPLPDDIPSEVTAIVMRCLKKEPGERWSSGAELAEQCRRVAARLPQGDSTEAMDTPTDTGQTVRVAAPAVGDTQSMAVATDDSPPAASGGLDAKSRKRRQFAAIIAAVFVLLVVGTAAAWRPWETPAVTEPADDTTSTTSDDNPTTRNQPTSPTHNYDDGNWQEPEEPETSSPSPDPTSPEPSSPEPSDDDDDSPTEPTDEEPESPSTSPSESEDTDG